MLERERERKPAIVGTSWLSLRGEITRKTHEKTARARFAIRQQPSIAPLEFASAFARGEADRADIVDGKRKACHRFLRTVARFANGTRARGISSYCETRANQREITRSCEIIIITCPESRFTVAVKLAGRPRAMLRTC